MIAFQKLLRETDDNENDMTSKTVSEVCVKILGGRVMFGKMKKGRRTSAQEHIGGTFRLTTCDDTEIKSDGVDDINDDDDDDYRGGRDDNDH